MKSRMIIHIFIMVHVASLSKLFKEAFTATTIDLENWQLLYQTSSTSTSTSSICGSTQLLGGYKILGIYSVVTNLFQLTPHSQIRITFDFWKIDLWNSSDKIIVYIDEQLVYQEAPNQASSSNICGDNTIQDQYVSIDKIINHNFNSALLVIQTSISTNNGYWGINNFKIFIEECPQRCQVCEVGQLFFECNKWNKVFQQLTETNLMGFDVEGWKVNTAVGQSQMCSNIPSLCGYNLCGQQDVISKSIQLPRHSAVLIQYKILKIDSWDAYDNDQAILKLDHNQIQVIKGDGGGYSLCGISSTTPQDGAYYEKIINVQQKIQHSILNLLIQIISHLNEGPGNESLGIRDVYVFVNNMCFVQYYYECCGDSIKQRGEDCDDGNMIPFDGCHNCQYSCIDGCLNCVQGRCIEYEVGLEYYEFLTIENQIYFPTKCQKCEKGWGLSEWDVIQAIQPLCDIQCDLCRDDKCLVCAKNYQFNYLTNKCETICGNNFITLNEKCDDSNNQIYDGCYQCQNTSYKICDNQCSFCYFGECYRCIIQRNLELRKY